MAEEGLPPDDATKPGHVKMTIGPHPVELHFRVPVAEVPLREMLPLARLLTDSVVAVGVAEAEAAGQRISCKAGCGACCRQLVPVSLPEIRALRRLVSAMPEPRRSAVRRRFMDAMERLRDLGWLERLRTVLREEVPAQDAMRTVHEYFHLGIPCPFLEQESCSVYEDRPAICREYLVHSPAENCLDPKPGRIDMLELHGTVSRVLREAGLDGSGPAWLPLVFLLHWNDEHPERERTLAGQSWAEHLLGRVVENTRRTSPGATMAEDL